MTADEQRRAVLDDLLAIGDLKPIPEDDHPQLEPGGMITGAFTSFVTPALGQLWPAMAAIPRPGALGRDGSLESVARLFSENHWAGVKRPREEPCFQLER